MKTNPILIVYQLILILTYLLLCFFAQGQSDQQSIEQFIQVEQGLVPLYGQPKGSQDKEHLDRLIGLVEDNIRHCNQSGCSENLLAHTNYFSAYAKFQRKHWFENQTELSERDSLEITMLIDQVELAKNYFENYNSKFYYKSLFLQSFIQLKYFGYSNKISRNLEQLADNNQVSYDLRAFSKYCIAYYLALDQSYYESLEAFHVVLALLEKQPIKTKYELSLLEKCHNNIADLYALIQEIEKVHYHYDQSMKYSLQIQDTTNYLWTAFNDVRFMIKAEKYDSAQDRLQELVSFTDSQKNEFFDFVNAVFTGLLDYKTRNEVVAEEVFDNLIAKYNGLKESKALDVYQAAFIQNIFIDVYLAKAQLNIEKQNWDGFKKYMFLAIDEAGKGAEPERIVDVFNLLELYEIDPDVEQAINEYKASYQKVLALSEIEKQKAVKLTAFLNRVDSLNLQTEMALKNSQQQKKRTTFSIVFFLLLGIAFTIIIARQLIKRASILKKESKEAIKKETDLQLSLKEKMVQSDRQEELLVSLGETISQVENESIQSKLADTLIDLQHQDIMDLTQQQFFDLNKEYVQRLLTQGSKLTANNVALCLLVKSGFSNGQIAEMRYVNKESVKIAKHRLKKKLDVPSGVTLYDFLNSI